MKLTVKKSSSAGKETRINAGKSLTGQRARPAAPVAKVFIVEDHPVFRQGLAQMIEGEEDFSVRGFAQDAETALPAILRVKPDIILVDLTLPGKSGLELIKEIRSQDTNIKILVISMHDEALYADRVLRAGGDGYVMKQEAPDEIIHAIRDILAGHLHVSEAVLAAPKKASKESLAHSKRRLDQLSDEELEFLELAGRGKSHKEMGRELKVGPRAIAARSLQVRKKMGFKSADELLRYAVCWVETGAS